MNKKLGFAAGLLILVSGAAAGYFLLREDDVPTPPPPAQPSDRFKSSDMLPTLESPVPAGRNAIWCGAFQLAWNRLKTDVVHEPIRLRGAEALAATLNASAFGEGDLPADSFYAVAGLAKDDIVGRIRREMAGRFPSVQPNLPDVPNLGAMAYAYLAARLKFKHPYLQQTDGVPFRDGSGQRWRVRGFGVRPMDVYRRPEAFHQAAVLYHGAANPVDEVVVDLDPQSAPHQILLALMPRPASLADGIAWVDRKLRGAESYDFSGGETLLVPEVAVGMIHHFAELEGAVFQNKALEEYFVAVAQQMVRFRLDRGGAELEAEAVLVAAKAADPRQPLQVLFDRPFLLLMKARNASRPYFAVWIDNVELLAPR